MHFHGRPKPKANLKGSSMIFTGLDFSPEEPREEGHVVPEADLMFEGLRMVKEAESYLKDQGNDPEATPSLVEKPTSEWKEGDHDPSPIERAISAAADVEEAFFGKWFFDIDHLKEMIEEAIRNKAKNVSEARACAIACSNFFDGRDQVRPRMIGIARRKEQEARKQGRLEAEAEEQRQLEAEAKKQRQLEAGQIPEEREQSLHEPPPIQVSLYEARAQKLVEDTQIVVGDANNKSQILRCLESHHKAAKEAYELARGTPPSPSWLSPSWVREQTAEVANTAEVAINKLDRFIWEPCESRKVVRPQGMQPPKRSPEEQPPENMPPKEQPPEKMPPQEQLKGIMKKGTKKSVTKKVTTQDPIQDPPAFKPVPHRLDSVGRDVQHLDTYTNDDDPSMSLDYFDPELYNDEVRQMQEFGAFLAFRGAQDWRHRTYRTYHDFIQGHNKGYCQGIPVPTMLRFLHKCKPLAQACEGEKFLEMNKIEL